MSFRDKYIACYLWASVIWYNTSLDKMLYCSVLSIVFTCQYIVLTITSWKMERTGAIYKLFIRKWHGNRAFNFEKSVAKKNLAFGKPCVKFSLLYVCAVRTYNTSSLKFNFIAVFDLRNVPNNRMEFTNGMFHTAHCIAETTVE